MKWKTSISPGIVLQGWQLAFKLGQMALARNNYSTWPTRLCICAVTIMQTQPLKLNIYEGTA
jgi:hypothetical protein